MGWLSSVWDAVKSVGGAVKRVVNKVYEVCTSESAVSAYDNLEKIIIHRNALLSSPGGETPDFYKAAGQKTSQLEKKVSQANQALVKHQAELDETKRVMALQIELTRLRSSADLIDRSMKNVKLHASSLLVHYQNMRNINGLIDDVNTLRYGLKAVISTINHNSNVLSGSDTKLRKIEGVDIDKTEGAISQVAAYDAFDRTRELLRNEVIELSTISTKHLQDIQSLKANAADLGGEIGGKIIDFVDLQIIPIIKAAESAGLLLKSEVSALPSAVRDNEGSLVFEQNNRIKLERVD